MIVLENAGILSFIQMLQKRSIPPTLISYEFDSGSLSVHHSSLICNTSHTEPKPLMSNIKIRNFCSAISGMLSPNRCDTLKKILERGRAIDVMFHLWKLHCNHTYIVLQLRATRPTHPLPIPTPPPHKPCFTNLNDTTHINTLHFAQRSGDDYGYIQIFL